jgi:hypothetical protein
MIALEPTSHWQACALEMTRSGKLESKNAGFRPFLSVANYKIGLNSGIF